jgi:hypothetical protein
MRRWLDAVDFAARVIFFAVAPFIVFVLASIFPVAATLVNIGLCLVVYVFADVARNAQGRIPLLNTILGGPLEFERYYRNHPPKPFAYYIFFPFLFPYWLAVDHARREFLLYKTVNILSITMLVATAAYGYFAYYRPELGVKEWLTIFVVTGLIEIVVVMVILMPLATSFVKYRLAGQRSRLVVLVAVGLLSVAVAVTALLKRRDPVVSWAARERVVMRTKASKTRARAAQLAATRAAWKSITKHKDDVEKDGKISGEPMDAAREALKKFYKDDEAQAFDAWASHGTSGVLVLYVEARRKRPAVFMAVDRAGKEIRDAKKLPKGALDAMKLAADGLTLEL